MQVVKAITELTDFINQKKCTTYNDSLTEKQKE